MKRLLTSILMLLSVMVMQAQQVVHTVQRGETLESIAEKYHVTKETITQNNPNAADAFYVGLKLYIPTTNSEVKADNPNEELSTMSQEKESSSNVYSSERKSNVGQQNVEKNSQMERFGFFGLGFYPYSGENNYSLSFGFYQKNFLGFDMNLRSNLKFKDHRNTTNADILLNFSLCIYENDDITLFLTPEIGPSIGMRDEAKLNDKGKIEYKEKVYFDGFMGIKAIIRYKKVLLSAGYNIWAPKWKFGKGEKADGFYAQLGFDI